jgi:hypothetical protein
MEEKLKEWLGEGWELRTERVAASNWRKPTWRAEFLCQRARLGKHHVHDEPIDRKTRKVWFGIETG